MHAYSVLTPSQEILLPSTPRSQPGVEHGYPNLALPLLFFLERFGSISKVVKCSDLGMGSLSLCPATGTLSLDHGKLLSGLNFSAKW